MPRTSAKPYLIGATFGVLIGAICSVLLLRGDDRKFCSTSSFSRESPQRGATGTVLTKSCGWGFGLSAESANLLVERAGNNGWSLTLDLELDRQTPSAVSLEWRSENLVEAIIRSKEMTGTTTRTVNGLSIVRTYVKS